MSPDKEPINMISDIYPAPTCDRPAPKLFSVRSGVIVYEWGTQTERESCFAWHVFL